MKTILVSGSDTGIGKTWVTGTLARFLCDRGFAVQIVKPVETGITDTCESDVDRAKALCQGDRVTSFVLRRFGAPLAPMCAASAEGVSFCCDDLASEVKALPEADFRIVEGAGSLAVPLGGDGRDWSDFALSIGTDKTVLVVADVLGAIGQARLVMHLARSKSLDAGIVLNRLLESDEATRRSNFETLRMVDVPVWARQEKGVSSIEILEPFWK